MPRIAMILEAMLTCPWCGAARPASVLTDACQSVYHCIGGGVRLRTKRGNRGVFCSYATDT